MLGYILCDDRGDANGQMAELAVALMADGLRLAGAVQTNIDQGPRSACHVELTILGAGGRQIRISQSLGGGAQGCRLDSDALEQAVALAAGKLTRSTDLLMVNKFGKQEAAGRGFRDLIGLALSEDIPVLTTVAPSHLDDFLRFAADFAVPLTWDLAPDWCRTARPAAA